MSNEMLALDSERWKELTTFFDEPVDIPNVLREWMEALGLEEETTIYGRDLHEMFLHQNTITNAAFAIVPWIVQVCDEGKTNFQIEYFTDVALVEANRLKYGLYYNRPGTAEEPDWLMEDYKLAITRARQLAEDALVSETDEERTAPLLAMKPALYGDAELAWEQW